MEYNPIIKISHLNPLRFHNVQTGGFSHTLIPDFETKKYYIQKFCATDEIRFSVLLQKTQIESTEFQLLNLNGDIIFADSGYTIGEYGSLYDVWGCSQGDDLISLINSETLYFIKLSILTVGGVETGIPIEFLSDPFTLLEDSTNTLNITYTHHANRFDMAFYPALPATTQESFQFRIEGGVLSEGFIPSSKDTAYIDQEYKVTILNSIPFDTYKFTFGPSNGLPNWVAKKLNMIFALSDISINGRKYTKAEGAKLEANRDKGYPFAGWQIELMETEPNYSLLADSAVLSRDYNNDYNDDYF